MRNIFSDWNSIETMFRGARSKLFLFDFDGTLSAIARHPDQAKLNLKARSMLLKLNHEKGSHVGIISGRSLRDIQKKVGLKNITYAGNHGLEMIIRRTRFVHPVATMRAKLLPHIKKELHSKFHRIKGLIIEDKGMSLSLHYRNVNDGDVLKLKRKVVDVMPHVFGGEYFRLFPGKKVIEIRPRVNWNKGLAVKKIRSSFPRDTKIVYVGDDVTDEDVFSSLKKKDYGIRVGKSRLSKATYYLKSQKEISLLLQRLVKLCR